MKPLTIDRKKGDTIFTLSKRAINQAYVNNKIVIVNSGKSLFSIVYPNDRIESVIKSILINDTINELKAIG